MDKSKITERVVTQLANEKSAGVKEDYDMQLVTNRSGLSELEIKLFLTPKNDDWRNSSNVSHSINNAHYFLLKTVRKLIKDSRFEISDDYWNADYKAFTGECVVVISERKAKTNLIKIENELHKKIKPLTR